MRYSVDVQVEGGATQSSVVIADTSLEAELTVVDNPQDHVHSFNEGDHVEVVSVREIYDE